MAVASDAAGYAALSSSLGGAGAGAVGLLALGLLLLPNAAAAVLGLAAGPGFVVGSGTSISVHGVTLGSVPALPMLAALPDTQAVPLLAFASQVVPALAGLVAGVVLGRRMPDAAGGSLTAALWGLLAGGLLGVLAAAAVWVGGGSLGDGGLAVVGAPPLATGLAVAAQAGIAADGRRRRGPLARAGLSRPGRGAPLPDAWLGSGCVPAADPTARARVVVLLSGTGSLCAALLAATDDPGYPATVVAVGADRPAEGLEHARRRGLPTFVVPLREHPDRAAWDRALAAAIAEHRPDLVVSAGFMKIVGPAVLDAFGGRLVNTHPALLPAFPGAHAVRDALAAGVPVTGATVHLVDAGVDTGPVLAQREVPVLPGRRRGPAARAHQDRGARAPRGDGGPAGPPTPHAHQGEHPMTDPGGTR